MKYQEIPSVVAALVSLAARDGLSDGETEEAEELLWPLTIPAPPLTVLADVRRAIDKAKEGK